MPDQAGDCEVLQNVFVEADNAGFCTCSFVVDSDFPSWARRVTDEEAMRHAVKQICLDLN
jgi:hypothetical protein